MKVKLAIYATFLFLFGCGLDTAGSGPDGDDYSPSDVPDQEAGPDIGEDEVAEVVEDHFELTEEDVSPEATDEAADYEETEAADAEDEASEEDGEGEDGEITDPCAPPEIPTTGLFLWYCIPDPPVSIGMAVGLWVERLSGPPITWRFEPSCGARDARSIFCELTDYGPGSTYYFNVTTPSIGAGWSCGPDLEVTHGVPRIWHHGWELEVGVVDNGYGGCNHTFEIAPL